MAGPTHSRGTAHTSLMELACACAQRVCNTSACTTGILSSDSYFVDRLAAGLAAASRMWCNISSTSIQGQLQGSVADAGAERKALQSLKELCTEQIHV
jgi:hypothetical protein